MLDRGGYFRYYGERPKRKESDFHLEAESWSPLLRQPRTPGGNPALFVSLKGNGSIRIRVLTIGTEIGIVENDMRIIILLRL